MARKARRGFCDGFVVRNGFRFCLVWGFYVTFVAHEARMESAKRDVGFVVVWDGFGFVGICGVRSAM